MTESSDVKAPEYHTDKITVGADPEFFLVKDGEPISAHDIVPGTKEEPFPLKPGIDVQADGTAVEFNISPASSAQEFSDSIADALREIRKIIPKEYAFSFTPSVEYSKKYFADLPENVKRLGCSPDFSATFNGKMIDPPCTTKVGTLRAAGGHIHVGWAKGLDVKEPGHLWDCVILVQGMDNHFKKNYSKYWDVDRRRETLYGKNAPFRPKSYGVEYRGLSSKWLEYPKLWPWIFESTKAIFNRAIDGKKNPNVWYDIGGVETMNRYYMMYDKDMPLFPVDFNK